MSKRYRIIWVFVRVRVRVLLNACALNLCRPAAYISPPQVLTGIRRLTSQPDAFGRESVRRNLLRVVERVIGLLNAKVLERYSRGAKQQMDTITKSSLLFLA